VKMISEYCHSLGFEGSAQTSMVSLLTMFTAALRLTLTDSMVTKAIKTQLVPFNNVHTSIMIRDRLTLSTLVWPFTEYTLQWFPLITLRCSPCMEGSSVTGMIFKFGWRCKGTSFKNSDLCYNCLSQLVQCPLKVAVFPS